VQIDLILDPRLPPGEFLRLGRLAEAAGVGTVWTSSLLGARDPFVNLVALAAGTSRLRGSGSPSAACSAARSARRSSATRTTTCSSRSRPSSTALRDAGLTHVALRLYREVEASIVLIGRELVPALG
jgi:hypothetical protein